MKNRSIFGSKKFIAVVYTLAIIGFVAFINSCQKNAQHKSIPTDVTSQSENMPALQNQPQTDIVLVLGVQNSTDGKSAKVIFSRHELVFSVSDATILAQLTTALQSKTPVKITFNPWQATVLSVNEVTPTEHNAFVSRVLSTSDGNKSIDITSLHGSAEAINHIAELGIINTTTSNLTPAIPDMETAQLIFNYFSAQCCRNPGPYTVDHCITFQYCEDGCYARAHKMCYLLNNKYHYATQKVFSFAIGGDNLSVKAEKWGGCCINWWYHVAPLVTIKTTTGPKAFVFDPAMFDQPVLLATWLHAQENPACSSTPHVTTINIQPTASYSPSGYGVTTSFDTDPVYYSTNSTLVSYMNLVSCP